LIQDANKGTAASLKAAALWLIGGTVVLYGTTYIAWKMGMEPESLFGWSVSAYAAIEPVRWYLALARVSAMVMMWWFWPLLVSRWFPQSLPGHADKRALWMALRHKILLMFLFLEGCIHVSYLGSVGLWA